MSENTEMIEYNIPFALPRNIIKSDEIFYYFPSTSILVITFKNYFISHHRKATTEYKSLHFIMNKKELYEEEIQNYVLSDPKNEIMTFCQEKRNFSIRIIISELI
jgi:hypothetical protein